MFKPTRSVKNLNPTRQAKVLNLPNPTPRSDGSRVGWVKPNPCTPLLAWAVTGTGIPIPVLSIFPVFMPCLSRIMLIFHKFVRKTMIFRIFNALKDQFWQKSGSLACFQAFLEQNFENIFPVPDFWLFPIPISIPVPVTALILASSNSLQ
jgi:hypothetical protein